MKHALGNVLEVELAIVSEYKGRQSNEQFRQWWMDIHEVLRLDISRSKLSKVNLIETVPEISLQEYFRIHEKQRSHNTIGFR